jgi:glutamine cyclotransferase
MAEKRKIIVLRMNGEPAKELNEIEFWRGRILANIWYEDVLLVIHPVTGKVEKEYGTYWLLTMLEASISCVFESVCSHTSLLYHNNEDFSTLWPKTQRQGAAAGVFNGISVSGEPDVLYVTGKKWNRMYKIKLLV